MITIPLKLPDQLAQQVLPIQDRLPEIIELGLRHWQRQKPTTPRERIEQVWETAGLVEPTGLSDNDHPTPGRKRRTPIKAGGQPASEIIIEQRGTL
ncbi:MAG: hypothetical protein V9H69_27455 [Anaerolineae bacterium]